jgi:hypothetical protein
MKIQELTRTTNNGEVKSTYSVGNLTVHLTSRFSDKVSLEDAMYQIILQRLRSKKEPEGRQHDDRKFNNYMV